MDKDRGLDSETSEEPGEIEGGSVEDEGTEVVEEIKPPQGGGGGREVERARPSKIPLVTHQDVAYKMEDIRQAIQRRKGRRRK